MTKKLRVAVLMGGKSSEYEISVQSGREIINNLDSKKYISTPLVISRSGKNWQQIWKNFQFRQFDIAFIAMHGPFGEDGTVQGLLELVDIPYTGSGVLASALAMDKIYSRMLFTQLGLKVPKSVVLKKGEKIEKILRILNFPIFVKPHNQGSSIGVSEAKDKNDLKKALVKAYKFSKFAIAEEFLNGVEVTAAVIGNQDPQALPLVEIVPHSGFFDYKAKYNESLCDEIVPARISKKLTKDVQKAAIGAYQALGCRDFGRVDMIVRGNRVYVLEVNTIPGLTPVSLFPKAAKAAGISYSQLLDKIISSALER